ncbi:MAG: isopentenyl-diphosphate Delta-isomerase [Cryobacterium sp.]
MHAADTLDALSASPEQELVILVDDGGRPTGTAPKSTVHDTETALHLAFSCHVFNERGAVLVTRRALSKRAWPGVWTNSFCGHPLPGEDRTAAVARRAAHELGLPLSGITVVLPDFRYRATDSSGIVENEICPVYVAQVTTEPVPNPDEVCEYFWAEPADLARAVTDAPWAFSPWLVLQMAELSRSADLEAFRA